jgi:hypothetical protein
MITIDLNKAKSIAHDRRRLARDKEFKPYDEIIMKQIPGKSAEEAESERQRIREEYAILQNQIDTAQTAEQLKLLLPKI